MRRVPQCVESPRLKSQKLQQEQKNLITEMYLHHQLGPSLGYKLEQLFY